MTQNSDKSKVIQAFKAVMKLFKTDNIHELTPDQHRANLLLARKMNDALAGVIKNG